MQLPDGFSQFVLTFAHILGLQSYVSAQTDTGILGSLDMLLSPVLIGRSGLVGVRPNRVNRPPASFGWSGWSANGRDMLVPLESIDSDKVYRQSVRFGESDRAPTAQ